MIYDRKNAVAYAEKYALSPNNEYYFFGGIGGDCTNFVSQCLFAGGYKMVWDEFDGWFYVNSSFRSPSWTGVNFFRQFLLDGDKLPRGEVVEQSQVKPGDVVFLFDGQRYYHTLFISKIEGGQIYVCSHSFASLNRPLDTYAAVKEFVHLVE